VNHGTVDSILARYPAWLRPVSAIESLGSAGGLSGARLWRYQSAAGLLVLRAFAAHGPGREHLEQVHEWLYKTADLGFVPVPLADLEGRTIQEAEGRLWELAPWMEGAADLARPSAAHVQAAFTGMAAFHQRLAGEEVDGLSQGIEQRYEAVRELTQGGFIRLELAIERVRGAALEIDGPALRWIALARPTAPLLIDPLARAVGQVTRLQPCLRDARAEHFLFDGERLSGLVDFGAMGVDSVAGDIARLIGDWLDGDPPTRALALTAYESVRPLEPGEKGLIGVFESATALLIGERWIRWHYLEGRRFDDARAVPEGLARGIAQLERLAESVGLAVNGRLSLRERMC
jgi:Ser/Thr protein kinase RdoA (MazF antagonist)